MRKETRRSNTARITKARVFLAGAILVFVAANILVLALLTFWFGLWGNDVLKAELTVPNGLLILSVICMVIGVLLGYSYILEQQNATLEQEVETLVQDKSMLERGVEELKRKLDSSSLKPVADYSLRIKAGKVFRGKEEITLAPGEFKLLKYLMSKKKEVCEYQDIFKTVWPKEYEPSVTPDKDKLARLILRLRGKITVYTVHHDYIKNYPGRGYEFLQWEE